MVNIINSKIKDYLSNHILRSTIINTLINWKRIKSTIDMINRLIEDNQIIINIFDMETKTINNDIIS